MFTTAGSYSFVILPTISPPAFNPVTFIVLFPAFKFSNTTDLDASVMVSAIFPFSAIVYFAIGLLFVIVVFNVIFFTVIFPLLTLIS